MHIIPAALCSLACTAAGYIKAYAQEEHKAVIRYLRDDIRSLSLQIDFTSEPLDVIFGNIAEGSELSSLWEGMREGMRRGKNCRDAWTCAADGINAMKGAFKQNERAELDTFFASLGRTDRVTEKKKADRICAQLDEICARTDAEANKNAKLYRSLGALCGMGLAILIL